MPETQTIPDLATYREQYRGFLDALPSEAPGEAYTDTVAARWRGLRVTPHVAARWVALGLLPSETVARWVLDGVTPELYLACDGPTRGAWCDARNSLSAVLRARAMRFIDVRDTEDGRPLD